MSEVDCVQHSMLQVNTLFNVLFLAKVVGITLINWSGAFFIIASILAVQLTKKSRTAFSTAFCVASEKCFVYSRLNYCTSM